MNIAIIGTGNVGAALGRGWAHAGHEVTFGSRDPKSPEMTDLVNGIGSRAIVATVLDACSLAEVVALAVPWPAIPEVLSSIAKASGGKILMDCTNPVKSWPVMDHSSGKSGGEQVAEMVPAAHVVKCFNTTGYDNMLDPKYPEAAATMFYAGDHPAAKQVTYQLAADLGFDPIDAGLLSQSHSLEVLASLWGNLAYGQKLGRGIAFRLMRR